MVFICRERSSKIPLCQAHTKRLFPRLNEGMNKLIRLRFELDHNLTAKTYCVRLTVRPLVALVAEFTCSPFLSLMIMMCLPCSAGRARLNKHTVKRRVSLQGYRFGGVVLLPFHGSGPGMCQHCGCCKERATCSCTGNGCSRILRNRKQRPALLSAVTDNCST